MTWSTDPSEKCFENSPKNSTIRPFNLIYCGRIQTKSISVLQSAHKQANPSFLFLKRSYPCTQTASAVPKHFPCLLQFCTGYRLWHASGVWKRKTSVNVDLHTAIHIQIQPTSFRYFQTNSYQLTSDLFTVVWPLDEDADDFRCSLVVPWGQWPED